MKKTEVCLSLSYLRVNQETSPSPSTLSLHPPGRADQESNLVHADGRLSKEPEKTSLRAEEFSMQKFSFHPSAWFASCVCQPTGGGTSRPLSLAW